MSQIFISIFSLALFTWISKYVYVLWHYARQKEYINKLEARVAVLRMLLKAKLKRKGSNLQDQYKDEKNFLASIAPKLELLTTYNFHRDSDYSEVLSLLGEISEAVDRHLMEKSPAFYLAHQDKMNEQKENLIKVSGVQIENADKAQASDGKSKDEVKAAIEAKNMQVINSQLPDFDKWAKLLKYDKGNLYIIKELVEANKELIEKIKSYNMDQEDKKLHIKPPEPITLDGFEGLHAIVELDQKKSKLSGKGKKKKMSLEELESQSDSSNGSQVA